MEEERRCGMQGGRGTSLSDPGRTEQALRGEAPAQRGVGVNNLRPRWTRRPCPPGWTARTTASPPPSSALFSLPLEDARARGRRKTAHGRAADTAHSTREGSCRSCELNNPPVAAGTLIAGDETHPGPE